VSADPLGSGKRARPIPAWQLEQILAWARYLYWADLCRARLDGLLEAHASPDDIPTPSFIALLSQWYASLWVVIEGWNELGLRDDAIDRLLTEHSSIAGLLRRYRNGVFHFQPGLLDERFLGMARAGGAAQLWVRILHDEFGRFLSDLIAALPGSPAQREEARAQIRKLVGWLPEGTRTDMIRSLEAELAHAEALLRTGDPNSTHASELREAILHGHALLASRKASNPYSELL
jgi:hypothetical protein